MTTLNPVEAQVEGPLDVAVIADTIRSIRLRMYPPKGETLDTLLDRVRGHVGLLLEEPLGPDDVHRYVIIRAAKTSLAGVPGADEPDACRWRYAMALATICETLLRRWITYAQPGGDYEVHSEADGDGYYVIDSVSGDIASRSVDGIARPARHLPAAEASVLARSLNDARESRRPAGRPQ